MNKQKVMILLLLVMTAVFALPFLHKAVNKCPRAYKIIHIASYSSDFIWVKKVENGILKAFKDKNCDIEFSAFYMDTKRKSSQEEIKQRAKLAIDFIKEQKPDIVITSDENALLYVVKPMQDSDYKFVSCGINGYPSTYGINLDKVAIVLERLHIVESTQVMQLLVPGVKKIIILTEVSKTSNVVMSQLREVMHNMPVEILKIYETNSFDTWKNAMKEYENKADAVMIGLYFTLRDKEDRHVETKEVVEWIIANAKLPDFSVIPAYVEEGGLLTVSVNGESQGYASADMAYELLEGKSPSELAFRHTRDGTIQINASRAKKLGLSIPLTLYESSQIDW